MTRNKKNAIIVDDSMSKVFESAAKLQSLVPNAVLVGGSAVSAHVGHRYSIDHDHVVSDLQMRFNIILDTITQDNWKTYKAIENKVILGELDGIQAGIRQLRRSRPLEIEELQIQDRKTIIVPTIEETLRVKSYYIVNRNQMRDYLDVVALVDIIGLKESAEILQKIDDYYDDLNNYNTMILTELTTRLANPLPKDSSSIDTISNYKGIAKEYSSWNKIVNKCQSLAQEIIEQNTA